MKKTVHVHQLALRVQQLSELFNSMDPTPFHHRDLDTDAQEYIESWAMAYPADSHFRIVVHIAQMPPQDPTGTVVEALHNYFDYKAEVTTRHLRLLLQEGRTSLAIGLSFLVGCVLLADLLETTTQGTFFRVIQEGLLIGGWVAMWRPMQIFLYEWWPLARRIKVYRALARAHVQVEPAHKEKA